MKKVIHVAVGVITDESGRVLIALRPQQAHQGGLWEFPGGKCEQGEAVEQALSRELHEELGITVLRQHPFCRIQHAYGDRLVLLDVWRVDEYAGQALGREGQPVRWADIAELNPAHFPAANRPIIRRLQLPDQIAITGESLSERDFFDRFTRLLAARPALVQLRDPALTSAEFAVRAQRCLQLCRTAGVRLLLNAEVSQMLALAGDGLHVSARVLRSLQGRPAADGLLFGASCHNAEELQLAEALSADFAFLSPVLPTSSHPGQPGMGWEQFGMLTAAANIPVYALGGLKPADIPVAKRFGAVGIASISGLWPSTSQVV